MKGVLHRTLRSPTKGTVFDLCLAREYLGPSERVLIVDDFFVPRRDQRSAGGDGFGSRSRPRGLRLRHRKRGLAGGGKVLARFGVPVVSLVTVARMDPQTGRIEFAEE